MYNFLLHVILIYNFIHYKILINFLLSIKRYCIVEEGILYIVYCIILYFGYCIVEEGIRLILHTLLYFILYTLYQKILYCRGGYSPNSVSKLRLNASINIGPVLCFSRHSPGSRPRSDVYPNIQ